MLHKPGFPAEFSEDRGYRYVLWRTTSNEYDATKGYLNFICLNPSTADERVNDPTMRRIVGYAFDWGYKYVVMTNLFAFRSSSPDILVKAKDPVGPMNDLWLRTVAEHAGRIVFGWGTKGSFRDRESEVMDLLFPYKFFCLGKTHNGQPKHPLYLPKNLTSKPYYV